MECTHPLLNEAGVKEREEGGEGSKEVKVLGRK